MSKNLSPKESFQKHIYNRNQFAKYLQWSHILKVLKKDKGQSVLCDFGCSKGDLAEVIAKNPPAKIKKYVGFDSKNNFSKNLLELPWVEFIEEDLMDPLFGFKDVKADIVTSFGVLDKQDIKKFLKHFKQCGNEDATYFLSASNSLGYNDLKLKFLDAGFLIEKSFGLIAYEKDFRDEILEHHEKVFSELKEYYDFEITNLLLAPLFPEQAESCLWILKQNKEDL